jgi:hypothetical protein
MTSQFLKEWRGFSLEKAIIYLGRTCPKISSIIAQISSTVSVQPKLVIWE